MSAPLPGGLTARMALSAHGWAVVIDGVLNANTVALHRNDAAEAALWECGFEVEGADCETPDCDCLVKVLNRLVPQARLVPVVVEVRQE